MMAFLTTWMRKNMIWFVRVVLFLHLAKDDPKVIFAVVKTVEDGSWTLSHKSNWPASYKKWCKFIAVHWVPNYFRF
jgi:hypothetical protein